MLTVLLALTLTPAQAGYSRTGGDTTQGVEYDTYLNKADPDLDWKIVVDNDGGAPARVTWHLDVRCSQGDVSPSGEFTIYPGEEKTYYAREICEREGSWENIGENIRIVVTKGSQDRWTPFINEGPAQVSFRLDQSWDTTLKMTCSNREFHTNSYEYGISATCLDIDKPQHSSLRCAEVKPGTTKEVTATVCANQHGATGLKITSNKKTPHHPPIDKTVAPAVPAAKPIPSRPPPPAAKPVTSRANLPHAVPLVEGALTAKVVDELLAANVLRILSCPARMAPGMAGVVRMKLSISKGGGAVATSMGSNLPPNVAGPLIECLAGRLGRIQFPAADGRTQAIVTFTFPS